MSDMQSCSRCKADIDKDSMIGVCSGLKEFTWVLCNPFQTFLCKACRVGSGISQRGFLVPIKETHGGYTYAQMLTAVEDWLVKAKEDVRCSSNEAKQETGPDLTPKVHISRREWDRYIESIKETCIVYENQYPDHYPVLSIPSVAFTFSKRYLKMTHVYKNHIVELLRN